MVIKLVLDTIGFNVFENLKKFYNKIICKISFHRDVIEEEHTENHIIIYHHCQRCDRRYEFMRWPLPNYMEEKRKKIKRGHCLTNIFK